MSEKTSEIRIEEQAAKKQPKELKDKQLDQVQGGRKAYDLNPNDLKVKDRARPLTQRFEHRAGIDRLQSYRVAPPGHPNLGSSIRARRRVGCGGVTARVAREAAACRRFAPAVVQGHGNCPGSLTEGAK